MTEYNVYQLHAVKTADGRLWCQRCFICDKSIDFLKMAAHQWVKVGELVRHRKCYPGMPIKHAALIMLLSLTLTGAARADDAWAPAIDGTPEQQIEAYKQGDDGYDSVDPDRQSETENDTDIWNRHQMEQIDQREKSDTEAIHALNVSTDAN